MDRVRRGDHDLTGLPDALRRLVESALDPDPARRPSSTGSGTCSTRTATRALRCPTRPPDETEDLFTMPLAIAAQAGVLPAGPAGRRDRGAAHPGRTPHLPARWVEDRTPSPPSPHWSPRPRPGLLGRPLARPPQAAARRVGRPAAPAARAPARARPPRAVARRGRRGRGGRRRGVPVPGHRRGAAPGVAAAQRLDDGERDRRPAADAWRHEVVRRRGRAAVRPVAPGPRDPDHRAAVLLGRRVRRRGWLLCYAFSVSFALSLFVSGVALAGGLYLGPGGSRVRRPLSRLVIPLSRTTVGLGARPGRGAAGGARARPGRRGRRPLGAGDGQPGG